MLTLQRILCPVDLSPISRHAFEHATALAGWYGAQLNVLHVYNVLIPPMVTPGPAVVSRHGAVVEVAPEEVAATAAELRTFIAPAVDAGIRTEIVEEEGDPATQIVAQARWNDLVVMGTHGYNFLQRFLIGSVTERVLRAVDRPLLTVPAPCAQTVRATFKRVLCAIDFSPSSITALEFALSVAQEADAELTLLHVVDGPTEDDPRTNRPYAIPEYRVGRERDARYQLESLVPAHVRDWCEPHVLVRTGRPSGHILSVAGEIDAELIVMGVRGHRFLDAMFVGSTANDVVRHASCPVLTTGRDSR